MRIRVFHIVDTLLGMGGMEKGVVNLIRRLDPDRYEHIVCVLRSLGTLAELIPTDRARVICLGDNGSGMRFQTGILARQIKAAKPHIVHSRNWGTIEGVFASRYVGCAGTVYSEHGMERSCIPEPRRRRLLRRAAFQLADRVLSVSFDLRDHYASITGFPARKISVIHNGVDTALFHRRPEEHNLTRKQFGVAPDEFCIGTVGRLEPIKDLLTLLRAAVHFPAAAKWRLLIAGDGSELPALQQFVRDKQDLRSHVNFLGEIQNIPAFLNCLDAYVLPSLYEGISNSLLEAMSSGLGVIASSVGGNTEVVVDGESGLLFPAGDVQALVRQLLTLYSAAGLRKNLGCQARDRIIKFFSLDSMVGAYDRLYSGLLHHNSR